MTQHSAFLYACLLLTISLRDDFTVSAAEENQQSLAGESCTTTDDCFGGKACLGGEGNKRCCDFTDSDFNAGNAVCTRDATRAAMIPHRIFSGIPNLASVRRVHLGTLTSTDVHIQPSRISQGSLIMWGAACLTTFATSAHSI